MIQLLHVILYIFYTTLFFYLIHRWKFFDVAGASKKQLSFFFALKVLGGIGLTLLYTYYYTDQSKVDIYRYFNDSKIISSVLFNSPLNWFKIISGIGTYDPETFEYFRNTQFFSHPASDPVTNNAFLIRVVSILNYFSCYNIYIDTLFFNFITFIGLTALYKALRIYFAAFEQVLFVPLFLLPSLIFWGSGLLKESLTLAGIAIYLAAWLSGMGKRSIANLLTMIISLVVVLLTKSYVALILVGSSALLPLAGDFAVKYLSLINRIVVLLIAFAAGWFVVGNHFCEKIIDKRNEFVQLSISEHAGSALDNDVLAANCESFYAVLPRSFVNAFLRPFLWDKGSVFQIAFAAENLLLVVVMIGLLFFFKRPNGTMAYIAAFCIVFALLNYLVIGTTIPVLGAIVHYRIVAAPFLLLGVLCLTDLDRLKHLTGRLPIQTHPKSFP